MRLVDEDADDDPPPISGSSGQLLGEVKKGEHHLLPSHRHPAVTSPPPVTSTSF